MKRLILSAIPAALCLLALTACGQKVYTYTTDEYMTVVVSGFDGKGKADAFPDRDTFYELIDRDLFDNEGTDLELAQMEVNIYDAVDYEIIGETENLSNGDTITIKLTADNERLKKLGVSFKEDEYVYTVEGLEEAREIDLFSDVSFTCEGISGRAQPKVEYTGNDEFITKYVRYALDDYNGKSNGDTVTIKAMVSDYDAEMNNVTFKDKTKTVEISGLDEYLSQKPADSNAEAEMDKWLDEYIRNVISNSNKFSDGSEISSAYLMRNAPSSMNIYKILDCKSATPIEKMVLVKDGYAKHDNEYLIFYKLNFDIEKTENENQWVFGNDEDYYDENEIGSKTVSDDVYYAVYLYDVIQKADGTIEYDTENNYGWLYYGWEMFLYNLTGHPYEDIREKFLDEYSEYDVVYSEMY